MARVYQRQYTDSVSWENTPSVATPIDADNLNKMDEGLQAIDAAVEDAVNKLEQMIEAGGGRGWDTLRYLQFTESF